EPGFWAVEDRATKKRAEKKPKCFKMPPRERSLGGRQHFASKQVWSQAKMGRALPTHARPIEETRLLSCSDVRIQQLAVFKLKNRLVDGIDLCIKTCRAGVDVKSKIQVVFRKLAVEQRLMST